MDMSNSNLSVLNTTTSYNKRFEIYKKEGEVNLLEAKPLLVVQVRMEEAKLEPQQHPM